jgi:hypothetical protein
LELAADAQQREELELSVTTKFGAIYGKELIEQSKQPRPSLCGVEPK